MQLTEEDKVEDDVVFYLVFTGSTVQHCTSTRKINPGSLETISPGKQLPYFAYQGIHPRYLVNSSGFKCNSVLVIFFLICTSIESRMCGLDYCFCLLKISCLTSLELHDSEVAVIECVTMEFYCRKYKVIFTHSKKHQVLNASKILEDSFTRLEMLLSKWCAAR